MRTSLQKLLEAARTLPGDRDPVECRVPSLDGADGAAAADLCGLRAEVGALLRDLAVRTEPALQDALARASHAWDQADAVSIVDEPLRARADDLRARWQQAAVGGQAGAAIEALLALDAAFGLVGLVERRLATLIRLRVTGGGELLPEGRPFIDVGAALHEAARGWA